MKSKLDKSLRHGVGRFYSYATEIVYDERRQIGKLDTGIEKLTALSEHVNTWSLHTFLTACLLGKSLVVS